MAKQKVILSGKDPMRLAAAASYIACLLTSVKKTQKEITKVANITEVTLKDRSKELKEKNLSKILEQKSHKMLNMYQEK